MNIEGEPQQRTAMFEALSEAFGKISDATKDRKNPHFKAKYATLTSVLGEIRPAWASCGLSVVQFPEPDGNGGHVLSTIVTHKGGASMSSSFPIPGEKSRGSNAQVFGSSLTYMRRYVLMAIAGIAPEDDDGEATAGRSKRSRESREDRNHRQAKHEPTWDERKGKFFAAIKGPSKDAGITYEDLKAHLAINERSKPSEMTIAELAELQKQITENGYAVDIATWIAKNNEGSEK